MKSGKEFKDRVTIVTKERNETVQVEGIFLKSRVREGLKFIIELWVIYKRFKWDEKNLTLTE